MHRRRVLRAVGTGAVAAATAGCLGTASEDADYDVGMRATAYVDEEITVNVGETVVWRNTSTRTHTVTAYEDAIPEEASYFASGGYDGEATAREEWWDDRGGAIETGEEFAHTFEVAGRYDYVCIPHEQGGMLGTVVVEG